MDNPIATIEQFDMTQADIAAFIEQVREQVEHRQTLALLPKLKAMADIAEGVKVALREVMVREAEYEGAKKFERDGLKYTRGITKSYSYKHYNTWSEIKRKLTDLQEVMKSLEEPMVDEETGEIIPPAKFTSTEFVSVTLKKL